MLEQRAQLQSWLQKLDSVGEEADTRVVERVRADYRRRLDAVAAALASHATSLRDELAAHRKRVGEASGRHDEARERFEEAQLRHRIGELGEDDWAHQREELESALLLTREELEHARADVRRLEEVVADLPDTAAGAAAATPAVDAAPARAVPAVDVAPAPVAPLEAPPAAAPVEGPPPAEVDDLPLVVSSPEPPRAPRPPAPRDTGLLVGDDVVEISLDDEPAGPAPTAYSTPEEASDVAEEDTLEFLEPLPGLSESTPPEPGTQAQGGETGGGLEDLAFLEELDRAIAGATQPPAAPAPPVEEDPEMVRPQPGTRCPECGYTNDVGAWICGVCRADLS